MASLPSMDLNLVVARTLLFSTGDRHEVFGASMLQQISPWREDGNFSPRGRLVLISCLIAVFTTLPVLGVRVWDHAGLLPLEGGGIVRHG
jgi:hypothetical protein